MHYVNNGIMSTHDASTNITKVSESEKNSTKDAKNCLEFRKAYSELHNEMI